MKKIFIITILIAFTSFLKAQTTTQEYNYARNGFVKDWAEGRTLPGYKIEEFSADNDEGIEMYLLNDEKGNTKACITVLSSLIFKKKVVAIPIGVEANSKLWETTFSDLTQVATYDKQLASSFFHYTAMALSEAIQECDKQSQEVKQVAEGNISAQKQLADLSSQHKTTISEYEKSTSEAKQLAAEIKQLTTDLKTAKADNDVLQKQLNEALTAKVTPAIKTKN